MQRKEIIPGLNRKERLDLGLEENDDVTFAINQVTMQGSALIERTHSRTMIKIPLMAIKGMTNSTTKVRGELLGHASQSLLLQLQLQFQQFPASN